MAYAGEIKVTYDLVIQSIDVTRLQPGDILHVTVQEDTPYEETEGVMRLLGQHVGKDVLVILSHPDVDISTMNESEMERIGWVRAQKQEADR